MRDGIAAAQGSGGECVKILAWETATEHVSVALWVDGQLIERSLPAARGAAEQVLGVVRELLAEAGMGWSALDLLAVGRGPGGFTGVRLGISIAQGLGFSTGIPVVPVSTLRAVAQDTQRRVLASRILVCQDARMGELYWADFGVSSGIVTASTSEQLGRPESVMPVDWPSVGQHVLCGSALLAYPPLLQLAGNDAVTMDSTARASAAAVARLAAHDGLAAAVPAAEVQPVYLRNDVAVPSAVVPL